MLKYWQKMDFKMLFGVAVCAVLVVGCGSNSSSADTPPVASTDISTDVGALVSYLDRLISTDGNSDGVDVNAVTLVQDDKSEPTAISF